MSRSESKRNAVFARISGVAVEDSRVIRARGFRLSSTVLSEWQAVYGSQAGAWTVQAFILLRQGGREHPVRWCPRLVCPAKSMGLPGLVGVPANGERPGDPQNTLTGNVALEHDVVR